MKRVLLLLLILVMVFTFAACGGDSGDTGEDTETPESADPIKIGFFAPITSAAASAYDAIQILFEALGAVGTDDAAALKDYISGMTDVETVTGNLIRYTSAGSAVKAVAVQQVQDGAFHYYGEVTDKAIINPDNY